MPETEYSQTYRGNTGEWRYNYNTGELERLGKKIEKQIVNGRMSPVVTVGILDRFRVRDDLFKKVPEYWVQLYDDVVKRKKE